MEPIGYMLSLTYSLLAYFYFLVTRGNYFDYGPFEEYWTQQQLVRRQCINVAARMRYLPVTAQAMLYSIVTSTDTAASCSAVLPGKRIMRASFTLLASTLWAISVSVLARPARSSRWQIRSTAPAQGSTTK